MRKILENRLRPGGGAALAAALCALLLAALPAAASAGGEDPAGSAPAQPGRTVMAPAPGAELVQVRRQVKEALLEAALTHGEMSRTFEWLESFVAGYTQGVRRSDPEVLGVGLEGYLKRKVGPRLASDGLTGGERSRLQALLRTWVDEELARDSVPAAEGR